MPSPCARLLYSICLINFNGMITRQGLFYAESSGNNVNCTSYIYIFISLFLASFIFYNAIRSNTNNFKHNYLTHKFRLQTIDAFTQTLIFDPIETVSNNNVGEIVGLILWMLLVGWILWHINLCRLFNTKSIFIQIVLFQKFCLA